MTVTELLEKALLLPLRPGVYIMRDKTGRIIYVGKARKLKNRVTQYFRAGEKNIKTEKMVEHVCDFEYIVCDTEMEALTLENSLIKQHTPKYNIRLKDCKSYPYIKVTTEAEYPRLVMTRKRGSDHSKYFGPYSGLSTAFGIINALERSLGIPSCKREFPRDIGKGRPCIYRQMGQCVGLCTGKVDAGEYGEKIRLALGVLKGDISWAQDELRKQMTAFSDNEEYEAAARCRDSIDALSKIMQRQKVVGSPETEQDIISLYNGELSSAISVFYIRGGAVTDRESFVYPAEQIIDEETISSFISSHYLQREYIPHEILLSVKLDEEENAALADYLSSLAGRRITLRTPERGELKTLCDMVADNAKESARQYNTQTDRDEKVLIRLADMLKLEVLPERIEAYDISNLASEHLTAGMIVTNGGRFERASYRTFNIKTVEGTDDYASMREALARRLSHLSDETGAFSVRPDLILLDGGRGHVSTVSALMSELGLDIPVYGMVKDDYHKTRALVGTEGEIGIARDQAVYNLIYRIQEEVHRFTVSRMEGAKRKTLRTSSLEKIPGIGEVKARLLLSAFGSIAKIKEADAEAIAKVKGISERDAEAVFAYYHKNNEIQKQELKT